MTRLTTGLAGLAMAMLLAAGAHAEDKTVVVKFAPGASSATINGRLKGYDANTYLLGANAGQILTIIFKPSNASCYYNVSGPRGGDAVYNGSTESTDFSGPIAESGNQSVMVYLMRNAARRNETCKFSLTVEIGD